LGGFERHQESDRRIQCGVPGAAQSLGSGAFGDRNDPLFLATSLILFGGSVEAAVAEAIKVDPTLHPFAGGWELLWRGVRYFVAFAATASLTAILYFYGPYRKQRWRRVWPGAILATSLWLLATLAFGWYVRNITNYNVLYGSVGTAIALLIWMYMLAAIALFGCEFNAENERLSVTSPVSRINA
jgi:membrane protein